MKKLIAFTLSVFFASAVLKAQDEKKLKFSVGPELSIAVGSFSNSSSFGVGGTGQVEINLQEKLYGTGTSGILFYNGKSVPNTNTKRTGIVIVPVRAGAKYFLAGGVYGAAQLGIAFISNNVDYNGTAFAYSPLILGYEFKTNSDKSFDAAIKYDAYSVSGGTIGTFGARLAYVF